MSLPRLRLLIRKGVVEQLSTRFDSFYEQLVRKEVSLFDHEKTRSEYAGVTFSSTAMHIGCGVARLARSRCDFFDEFVSTRPYDDCVLLGSKDQLVPLPRCHRTWMLKERLGPSCPASSDCTVCTLIEARHASAEQRLQSEIGGGTRYVCVKVLIQAPKSARMWDAYNRGELYIESCKQLPIAHAAALLIDTTEGVIWLCESERLTPQVRSRIDELAAAFGMRADVHRLCRQWQSTPEGRLRIEFCMLYSQAMALALSRTTPQTTTDDYLELVFAIMHRYMRQF
jgi:hypothetical protein